MTSVVTWKMEARRVIREALAEADERGLDRDATIALVDSRYPFGERKRHPYKVWLEARRALVTKPARPLTPSSVVNFWNLPKEEAGS